MLKNIFKKSENSLKDKILNSLLDGYVDIKAYRYDDNNNKKLVYHDTGDNTVTDWMRQVIVQLLSGVPFSKSGYGYTNGIPADIDTMSPENYTTYINQNHNEKINKDGCIISDTNKQYLHSSDDVNIRYSCFEINDDTHYYPLYPTKVLFGTGKEYTSWESLKEENEVDNATWFSEIVSGYSAGEGEAAAKEQINSLIKAERDMCNTYSATFGAQGVHTGGGYMLKTITVNDPNSSSVLEETPVDLSKRYGVVGAVKTLYLPDGTSKAVTHEQITVDELLNPTITDDGKLLKTRYRGVGRPCFIYFNRTIDDNDLDWSKQTSGVYVSKENSKSVKYLNRITFRVVMPSQKGTDMGNAYYPYNGYTLKQIGLFNDALMCSKEGVESDLSKKMPCGTMLAIKNIATFTKTADEELIFTWTLTV